MNFHTLNVLLCLCYVIVSSKETDDSLLYDCVVSLKKNESSHNVSDKFLSFGLDSSLLRNFKNLPIENEKFVNLTRHLKPAYIRIGGTAADCLNFNQTYTEKDPTLSSDSENYFHNSKNISNFTLTGENFLSIYKFSRKIGSRMLFDLNVLLRNPDGSWDSTNAQEILLFSKGHELEIEWQLGNEPNSFHHVFNISLTPKQLSKDYCELRKILNNSGYRNSILVGPEANRIGIKNQGNEFVKIFLKKGRQCIDFVTWHQYYLNGHTATKEDFLNSSVFERLPNQINVIKKSIRLSGHEISMWISETSSAYGGGAPELSNRFLAGFLWLDKLGFSAKVGVQVVVRQSLFGGDYALIGHDLEPNPDWWVSVLFKKFVSPRVLNLVTTIESSNVRLYAHCASKKSPKGSEIVIYGINLNEKGKKIYLKDAPEGSRTFSYILTSNDLQSRKIFLNGEILKLSSDGSLPVFKPKITDSRKAVKVPGYSMIFLLISRIDLPGCQM